MDDEFSSSFRTLTRRETKDGFEPLHWQRRLFKRFCQNDIPKVCDLPTGMGKTNVIHLWLLALRRQIKENNLRLPRRLVYVVDRRTVVDQATNIAEGLKKNLSSLDPDFKMSVSTLRGQFADNREWTIDPSRPAIIIGTVDMIGSRLLFSGYRSSYKVRPLDAGLLGQDTMLVLDEAHLSEPFAKLVHSIGKFQGEQGMPMRVMCMSATSATSTGEDGAAFKLEDCDLEGDHDTNPIIRRYESTKRLTIEPPADKSAVETSIIDAAVKLAEHNSRVVVFVKSPDDARRIAAILKRKPFTNAVEVLTGTMRGLERDELVEKPVVKRFLDGDEKPEDRASKNPAILVSTSAGEVGFDLNADHMVCDAAPLDSMIQRLGRVNRRGYGDATVRVFVVKPDEKKAREDQKPPKRSKHTFESATAQAIKCLEDLQPNGDGTRSASPKAIDELRKSVGKEQLIAASTPKPVTVDLTDILLDAWSMTSIAEPMPGRPPVAPWLRGIDVEEPNTTIAWRAELDLGEFDQLDSDDIEEWFDAHRLLPHEALSVPTSKAAKWILERWYALTSASREAIGERSCIIERAGLQTLKLKVLVEDLERKRIDALVSADLTMPAAFGGIELGEGHLDRTAPKVESEPGAIVPDPLKTPDVADLYGRCRLLRIFGADTDVTESLVGAPPSDVGLFARFALDLPSDGDTRKQLISLVPRRERTEFGTTKQPLWAHVGLVRKRAGEVARRLGLSGEILHAIELAAAWHDHGKDRDLWQRAVGRKPNERPLGKSGGSMQRIPGNYRHEFGSLREFIDAHEGKIAYSVFDLAMHLIAAHHGRGRPHFAKGGFDPLARAKAPQIATEVIRRFARLQREYGHWQLAWLENLLRCADAMASGESQTR